MKNTEKKIKKTTAAKPAAQKVSNIKKKTVKTVQVDKSKADTAPDITDAFINEVNEEVKNDSFKELWNRYGLIIIAIVVIAVSGAVSFEKIKSWKLQRNQLTTENYMDSARKQDNPDAMIAALQKINQSDHGIYGDFARLQIANIKFEQQKNEEALAMLDSLIKDKQVNDEVRHIALIKYATYQVDTLSKQELANLLKPVLEADNSWTPLANDLLAMAAIREGDLQTAREIYTKLLDVKDLSDSFKSKVQEMLSSLNTAE